MASGLAGGACNTTDEAPSTVPLRACGLVVWHKPASADARVQILGDWDGWKRPGITPERHDDGWRVAAIDVPQGEHAYAIIEDGTWLTDTSAPMTDTYEDHEVSVGMAVDCARPAVRVEKVATTKDGSASVEVTFVSAHDGAQIDPSTISAVGRDGAPLAVTSVARERGLVRLEVHELSRGKYTYTIGAKDTKGREAEDARATVWIDASSGSSEPWEPRDAIVYQVLLDRYRGEGGPLAAPSSPSARAGGKLAGVTKAIVSGEIESLGVSAIWLSPLYTNPKGEFSGTDGRSYTSYHGYWPTESRGIDSRFASEEELDTFMASAHARGIRVLFDVVPNHVHQEHAWTKEHPDWFNKDCVCGQGGCDWGAHIKTCWFAPYLPDLDWLNVEAAHAATSEVMWWFDRWDADGIRIDAVPMMPRAATRRIAAAARQRYSHPGNRLYVLGENFTGPGGYQSLRYDLGPYGLDGSFHFPLMWTLRESIAVESQPMSAIDTSYHAGEAAWNGANAVMGLMIGNHDVSRFASVSAGNADGDTWSSPPQPIDPVVYAKQRVALASVLTLPGAPVLYYGDEVGLAGRSDPDCRRVMPAESELLDEQKATRELARKIGRARSCVRALRRGTVTTLLADDEHYVFAREIDSDVAIVSLSRRPTKRVEVPLPAGARVDLVDVVTGDQIRAGSSLPVDADPFAVHVWLPAASSCAGTPK